MPYESQMIFTGRKFIFKVLSEIGIETMGQMERAPGAHSGQLGGQKEDGITDKDIENILAGLKS